MLKCKIATTAPPFYPFAPPLFFLCPYSCSGRQPTKHTFLSIFFQNVSNTTKAPLCLPVHKIQPAACNPLPTKGTKKISACGTALEIALAVPRKLMGCLSIRQSQKKNKRLRKRERSAGKFYSKEM
jgi:hypothetical protein